MDCGDVPEPFLETPEQAVKATETLIQKYDGKEDRLIVRPEAMSEATASKEMILHLRALSREADSGFHMHVAESRSRPERLSKATGFRTIRYLDHLGVLGRDVLLAHCVWVEEDERQALANSGTKVAHNPVSNQFLADGVAPIPALLATGVVVGLGSDGAASNNSLDMFEVMKAAALLQKIHHLDAQALTAPQVLEMATIGGARAIGIDGITGSLERGKRADILLLELRQPGMVPCYSTISNLVYSSSRRLVNTVIIEGRIVVEKGLCVSVDRDQVIEDASRLHRHFREVLRFD